MSEKLKFAIITPVVDLQQTKNFYQTQIEQFNIEYKFYGISGSISGIGSAFDYAIITPEVIRSAYLATQEGCDAILINCATEPGLRVCRDARERFTPSLVQIDSHCATAN